MAVKTASAVLAMALPLLLVGCGASEKGVMEGNAPPIQHMQQLGQQMNQRTGAGGQGAGNTPAPAPSKPSGGQ